MAAEKFTSNGVEQHMKTLLVIVIIAWVALAAIGVFTVRSLTLHFQNTVMGA